MAHAAERAASSSSTSLSIGVPLKNPGFIPACSIAGLVNVKITKVGLGHQTFLHELVGFL